MSMNIFASGAKYGAVTPSDTTALNFKALYIGGDGNVAIATSTADTAVTFVGVVAGTILPIQGRRVMYTNTTATNIVWLNW